MTEEVDADAPLAARNFMARLAEAERDGFRDPETIREALQAAKDLIVLLEAIIVEQRDTLDKLRGEQLQ
jgi:hypothetical protein